MGGRLWMGAIAAVSLSIGLAGCAGAGGVASGSASASPEPPSVSATPSAPASAAPSPSPSATVAAEPLEVLCDDKLVTHVSSKTVTTTSAGVPLLVSSEAPAGAYLNYTYGGDELPAGPTTWLLTMAPGKLALSCSTLDVEGAEVEVTVVDPSGYFSETTLADYGCERSAIVDWVIPAATGVTPEEAVANLVAAFHDLGTQRVLERREHAAVGYPKAATQIWVIGSDTMPGITAQVISSGSGYQASADAICDGGTWPTDG